VWMSFQSGGGIAQDRIFVNVLGRPKLPASQEAALTPALDRCMRERPPVEQTTPPRGTTMGTPTSYPHRGD
jgi:signal peptidase I